MTTTMISGGVPPPLRRRGRCSAASSAPWALLLAVAVVVWPATLGGVDAQPRTSGRFTAAELAGSYCAARTGVRCCRGREDQCTAPIRGDHLCYCDYWCDEHHHNDCCPDFERTCRGVEEAKCSHDGVDYPSGSTIKRNCNQCRCTKDGSWDCDRNACVVEQWLIDSINRDSRSLGWRAGSYSSMRGLTLSEGVRLLLGTRPPAQRVTEMRPIRLGQERLPDSYDARTSNPRVRPPRDQGLCGSDWAVAVADVVADRLSMDTNGSFASALSIQDLLDCGAPALGEADGCRGGRVEQAFWILKESGAFTEECYSYESGRTSRAGSCGKPSAVGCQRFKATPAYRISAQEQEIRKEILKYGPVVAVMKVRPDFFLYKEGIYRHSGIAEAEAAHDHTEQGLHAVRIIGWGTEDGRDFWLVANSWGHHWGESGLFRIARGTNESDIESFVLGTWSSARAQDSRRRRLRKKL